jgi:peptide-methionine (S)-S-oxide reductase
MAWRRTGRALAVLAGCSAAFAGAGPADAPDSAEALATATFAGGSFWCMEKPFDELEGVVSTTAGYTGGTLPDPTYGQVAAGGTGHAEAVQIVFDPARISYATLLEVFWHNIDPTTAEGQFCDRGRQYRPVIFHHDGAQRDAALGSRAALAASGRFGDGIEVEIVRATAFYPAEEHHQDYYLKNPTRYGFYRRNCGRDERLRELWGDSR